MDFNRKRWLRLVKKQAVSASWQKKHVDWLERLEDYAVLKGIKVVFSSYTKAYYLDKLIYIPLKASPLVQTMLLLHELGHALIGMRQPGERFGLGYSRVGRRACALISRVDSMDEEFEAWYRGEKLAERLGIQLPERNWRVFKARQLKAYARSISRRYNPLRIL